MGSNLRKIFAKNFREILEEKGIQQNEIANALNLSGATVSDWTRGRGYPRIEAMERLAKYLNVPVTDLMVERGSEAIMLTEAEHTLISLYRQIPQDKQIGVLKLIEDILEYFC